jgi:CRP-like cAMP-binding protein
MMDDIDKKVDFLKTITLCEDFSKDNLNKLAKSSNVRSFKKRTTIFMQSEPGEIFYIIVEGLIKITKIDQQGNEVIFAILSPGDFFGEMSIIDGDLRSANAISLTDVTLFTYPKKTFYGFIKDNFEFALNIMKTFAMRIRNNDSSIKSMYLDSAQKRILVTFNTFIRKNGELKDGRMVLPDSVNQADLARLCGTSRETFSRTLKKLEVNGFLERGNKMLIIPDYRKFVLNYGLLDT